MIAAYIRMSLHSIGATRARSVFTNLGIVIGIGLLIFTVNLSDGIQEQSKQQQATFGSSIVGVHSGELVERSTALTQESYRLDQTLTPALLSLEELDLIEKIDGSTSVTPIAPFDAQVEPISGEIADVSSIIGTTKYIPEILGGDIAYGETLGDGERERTALLGKYLAEKMFGEPGPIGKVIRIDGREHVVRGVFDSLPTDPLNPGVDYNHSIFIPIGSANLISDQLKIKSIYLLAADSSAVSDVQKVLESSQQRSNYSILNSEETVELVGRGYRLIIMTAAIVTAIALLVGGIGLSNIMTANVAERTREIGVRKAVGANRKHILLQFLSESVVLSVLGGLAGIVLAELVTFIVRSTTNLSPGFNLSVILVSLCLSLLVGVLFGFVPAWRAASKKPMEALRS
ncbi:MAG: ABC transporter permease [Patescibacteria group bacterium]